MAYRSRPQRKGYRLTGEGENLYSDWLDMGGCCCHTGCAPCSSCVSDGNPISLEEGDEYWEPDVVIKPATPVFPEGSPFRAIYEEWLGRNKDKSFAQQIAETEGGGMARDKIVNKSGVKDPPKCSWFGYKYRVTPETSELLQKAVFQNGGMWGDGSRSVKGNDFGWMGVTKDGFIYYLGSEYSFLKEDAAEGCPPQPKGTPEFKVGKWYKCTDSTGSILKNGKYYQLEGFKLSTELILKGVTLSRSSLRFDVNSECDYDPTSRGTPENIIKASNHVHTGFTGNKVTTYDPADVKIFMDGQEMQLDWGVVKEIKSNSINQQEESKMSNANNRRVLTVQVFDLDPALDVELSLVHVFKDVVTEDTNEVTLTELLHTGQLVEPLALHNKKRVAQDNKDILSRTGKKVKLEAIKVKNLSFKYV